MAEANKWMIDPSDAVMLLIDHQSGLFQLVRDMELPELRSNVTALAKVARLAKIPTFTTASVPDGPNGPLIPEIHQCNPEAVYIPRIGQINAWDNPAWVKAIEATKRKTLLIAGTLTSVCMAFPTLSALVAGYKVFAIIDASQDGDRPHDCPRRSGRCDAHRHVCRVVRTDEHVESAGCDGVCSRHG